MKEKIYTIPLNEAFDEDSECPFCSLFQKLEDHKIEYFLGAAMMEPDVRVVTNAKGFCHTHLHEMLTRQHTLSLALTLDTHLEQVNKRFDALKKDMDALQAPKKLFSKTTDVDKALDNFLGMLTQTNETCAVCDEIDDTMNRYYETFFYLYRTEAEFKEKVLKGKGFCLAHMEALLLRAKKELSGKEKQEFLKDIYALEKEHLSRINEELHYYTQKFDYRNQNADWKNSKDAPKRSVEKIVGR